MSVTYIALFLWLADVCETMKYVVGTMLFFGSLATVGMWWISVEVEIRKLWLFFMTFTMITFCVLFCLIPNKNTLYVIGGAYVGGNVVEKVSNSEEYKKIMELFNLSIDKALVELRKDKK